MASGIERNVLVGLVEPRPLPGNDELRCALGAFTNAVTRAEALLEAAHTSHADGVFRDALHAYESDDDE